MSIRSDPVILRAAVGLLVAGAIAAVAWRRRLLTAGGARAAVLVGTIALAAGWQWGALLVGFFVTSTFLSRYEFGQKDARTAAVVQKRGARDAVQVLVNSGVFAVAGIASVAASAPAAASQWGAAGAGALAAATADTWATELGTLAVAAPRSIITGRPVAPGTSGGVTLRGCGGAAAGAAFIAGSAWALGWPAAAALGALVGGVAGALADSLAGATVQARRWCDRCDAATERRVHVCGDRTRAAGGIRWLDNDRVNLFATAVGALVALLCAR